MHEFKLMQLVLDKTYKALDKSPEPKISIRDKLEAIDMLEKELKSVNSDTSLHIVEKTDILVEGKELLSSLRNSICNEARRLLDETA